MSVGGVLAGPLVRLACARWLIFGAVFWFSLAPRVLCVRTISTKVSDIMHAVTYLRCLESNKHETLQITLKGQIPSKDQNSKPGTPSKPKIRNLQRHRQGLTAAFLRHIPRRAYFIKISQHCCLLGRHWSCSKGEIRRLQFYLTIRWYILNDRVKRVGSTAPYKHRHVSHDEFPNGRCRLYAPDSLLAFGRPTASQEG